MKVPVARTKTGGFSDMKFCLPLSCDDSNKIVEIIRDILKNGLVGYQSRIEEAYKFAKEFLVADKMASSTVEIYKKACEKYE